MCRVIAVANQKGGVGKTTTAVNVSAILKKTGKKTLLLDTDGQCNSTDTCRAAVDGQATLYDLLFEKEPIAECIQKTEVADVIASDPLLNDAERKFPNDGSRLFLLREACEGILEEYDYIIIDTPPNLGCMLSNALTFADEVIIPVTCDRYGMQGIDELYNTISAARKYTNPNLKVSGILLIKYHANTILCREISENLPKVSELFHTKVFHTKIRESEACRKSQSARMSLIAYAGAATTTKDYIAFCKELEDGWNG